MVSFAGASGSGGGQRILVVAGGLGALLLLARSAWFDRILSALIARALTRWTDLDARDYASLLHLGGPYAVFELTVGEGDWVAGRALQQLGLRDEGILVLGIHRGNEYIGAPAGRTVLAPGDTAILYGRKERLCELDRRRAGVNGDRAHTAAVAEQKAVWSDRDRRPFPAVSRPAR